MRIINEHTRAMTPGGEFITGSRLLKSKGKRIPIPGSEFSQTKPIYRYSRLQRSSSERMTMVQKRRQHDSSSKGKPADLQTTSIQSSRLDQKNPFNLTRPPPPTPAAAAAATTNHLDTVNDVEEVPTQYKYNSVYIFVCLDCYCEQYDKGTIEPKDFSIVQSLVMNPMEPSTTVKLPKMSIPPVLKTYAKVKGASKHRALKTKEESQSGVIGPSKLFAAHAHGRICPVDPAPKKLYSFDVSGVKPSKTIDTITVSSSSEDPEIIGISEDEDEDMDGKDMLFTYPPDRKEQGSQVLVTRRDEEKLRRDTYLNDTLIDFFLLWFSDVAAQDNQSTIKDDVHIFNCFFYPYLTEKAKRNDLQSLSKWGPRTDIFKKKYLVIPVNESNHWFLMIVFNVDQCLHHSHENREPHIYVLDSMGGKRVHCQRLLVKYMAYEAYARHGVSGRDFVYPKHSNPSVPLQNNGSDCGLYLIHFVEMFLKDPQKCQSLLDVSKSM
ncbi:hypothetical protein CLU79DRAFT_364209 [Phycomyces nitens]|nr:hypothetical protein CLU79DRAFT_364209 [Phycomyces nitens]